MTTQILWNGAKAVLRGKFIAKPQETRKTLNRQANFTLNTTVKRRRTPRKKKKKKQQKERNHKDQNRDNLKTNKGNNSKDQ